MNYSQIRLDVLEELPLLNDAGRFSGPYGTAFDIETYPSYVRYQFEPYQNRNESHNVIRHPETGNYHIVDDVDLTTLWIPLEENDDRFKRFELAWWKHGIHTYVYPGYTPNLNDKNSHFFYPVDDFAIIKKFKSLPVLTLTHNLRDRDLAPNVRQKTMQEIEDKFESLCAQYDQREEDIEAWKNELKPLALPENAWATHCIREVYPEYYPSEEIQRRFMSHLFK